VISRDAKRVLAGKIWHAMYPNKNFFDNESGMWSAGDKERRMFALIDEIEPVMRDLFGPSAAEKASDFPTNSIGSIPNMAPTPPPMVILGPIDTSNVQRHDNITTAAVPPTNNMKAVWVTFQKEGMHCYPDAEYLPGVEFLSYPHRHIFKFKVWIQVFDDDRDIEFILFKRELEALYTGSVLELDHKSCEMISDDLAGYIKDKYVGRHLQIEVSEDGENGSTCTYGVTNAELQEFHRRGRQKAHDPMDPKTGSSD